MCKQWQAVAAAAAAVAAATCNLRCAQLRAHRSLSTHVDAQGIFHKLLKPAEQRGELLGSPGAPPLVQAQHKRLQLLQKVILLRVGQATGAGQ